MDDTVFKERLKELYLPGAKDFVLVDVPEMRFVMIDGEGNPEGEKFNRAVKWLFTVIHPIRLAGRKRLGRKFVEPPLEALWWADDVEDFIQAIKDKMKWRLMIVIADWVSEELYDQAVEKAADKLGDIPDSLRLARFNEGLCVQIMHVGPNSEEAATLARLHKEFLPENKLTANGYHHEIYLNDARRVAREKLKTVLRQPVRREY